MLQIPPITKLDLTDKMMQVIFAGLIELPYKTSQPVLNEIERQLATQQPTKPAPPGETAAKPQKNPKLSKAVKAAIEAAPNVTAIKRDRKGDGSHSVGQGQNTG
jgi:hypothetical protein